MNFSFNTEADASVLRIEGELDALSARNLKPTIAKIGEDRPRKVLVDLSKLRLIDSLGVGTLIALFKIVCAYKGSLTVAGVHDQPLVIFRRLQLDQVLLHDVA